MSVANGAPYLPFISELASNEYRLLARVVGEQFSNGSKYSMLESGVRLIVASLVRSALLVVPDQEAEMRRMADPTRDGRLGQ
jgi:hypothetical protein